MNDYLTELPTNENNHRFSFDERCGFRSRFDYRQLPTSASLRARTVCLILTYSRGVPEFERNLLVLVWFIRFKKGD